MTPVTRGLATAAFSFALAAACCPLRTGTAVTESADDHAIRNVIDNYPRALETADVDLWRSLFWTDDPRFTVIENDKPHSMGAEYIEFIADLLRKRGPQPPSQRWYDTKVYLLDPHHAYTVSLRDELNVRKTSRVTLLFLKMNGDWRVLHAHFSYVPE